MTSGLLSSYDGHLRNLNYAWQDNTDASGDEAGYRGSHSSWNSDVGIPIHFQKVSGIITFWNTEFCVPLEVSKGCHSPCPDEAETYDFLEGLHRGFRHPFIFWEERQPEFKPPQGNPAFLWVRASRGPFHLRRKTQCPSHIRIAEGKLHLRCLWKAGSPLLSKTGISSHLEMICGSWSFPRVAVLKLIFI